MQAPGPLSATASAIGTRRTKAVLKWALIFFVISVIAGLLGFTYVAAGTRSIARLFFAIFIVIFLIVLLLALTGVSLFAV